MTGEEQWKGNVEKLRRMNKIRNHLIISVSFVVLVLYIGNSLLYAKNNSDKREEIGWVSFGMGISTGKNFTFGG